MLAPVVNEISKKQETFNIVVRHLLKQGKRSEAFRPSDIKGEDKVWDAAYHGRLRRKCAVGILISDTKYSAALEGKDVTQAEVLEAIYSGYYKDPAFLLKLQVVHDHKPESKWPLHLFDVSEKEGLLFPEELKARVKFED